MRRSTERWLVVALLFVTAAYAVAEEVTLTTYYPSPRGVYEQLRAISESGDVLNLTTPSETNASRLRLQRRRLLGSGKVTVDDVLGSIRFEGYNTVAYQESSKIRGEADAPISGAGDVPGRLTFFTAPIGGTNPIERMRITKDGNVLIGAFGPPQNVTLWVSGPPGRRTAVSSGDITVTGNADVLNLLGTDHAYIQWYPDGSGAGRKAWTGFGSAADDDLTIANEIPDAAIQLKTTGDGFVRVQGRALVDKGLSVNGGLLSGNVGVWSGGDYTCPAANTINVVDDVSAGANICPCDGDCGATKFGIITIDTGGGCCRHVCGHFRAICNSHD